MSRTSVKVYGLKDLDKSLAELATATSSRASKTAVKRGLIAAAEPMAARARALVAVQSGALRDSITVSARLKSSAGKAAFAQAKASGASDADAVSAARSAQRAAKAAAPSVEVFVGPSGSPASRAHLVEFGTSRAVAKPFMRPAFEETAVQVIESVKGEVGAQVDKAIARARRKAAKLAAKA